MAKTRPHDLKEMFHSCDANNSGFIEKDDLKTVCVGLTDAELNELMAKLDSNQDGRINFTEFSSGYEKIFDMMVRTKRRSMMSSRCGSGDSCDEDYGGFIGHLKQEFNILGYKRQERLCEFYEHLHSNNSPILVNNFEELILGVIDDIKVVHNENEKLAEKLRREHENHQMELRKVEDEMLGHLQSKEAAIREDEQQKTREKILEQKRRSDAELKDLRRNLERLRNMEKEVSRREEDIQIINSLKTKITNLSDENKRLESLITDAQTSLTLVRSEITTLKERYQEKCKEVEYIRHSHEDEEREQECLSQQIQLLQEANRKLHDTNDDLKEALETAHRKMNQIMRQSTSRTRRSSRVGDYMGSDIPEAPSSSGISSISRQNSSVTEYDSGRSSFREREGDSDDEEPLSRVANARRSRRKRAQISRRRVPSESETEDGSTEKAAVGVDSLDGGSTRGNSFRFPSFSRLLQSGSIRSLSSFKSNASSGTKSTGNARRSGSIRSVSSNRSTLNLPQVSSSSRYHQQPLVSPPPTPTKEPERMYKIVLCGDTAVGKSSFIVRLCQNRFANNLATTLGVDFQTKTLEVDGHVISLQVWDTCGQERFRSIAKSYFRRADGVLLLYDTTYERSFISVREWMTSIQDATDKEIGVLIVGNKMDEKEKFLKMGKRVVHSDEGFKLAREYEALFIETSAKDGRNIVEAVVELTRLLRTNEDLEVRSVGLKLHEKADKDDDKVKCCK